MNEILSRLFKSETNELRSFQHPVIIQESVFHDRSAHMTQMILDILILTWFKLSLKDELTSLVSAERITQCRRRSEYSSIDHFEVSHQRLRQPADQTDGHFTGKLVVLIPDRSAAKPQEKGSALPQLARGLRATPAAQQENTPRQPCSLFVYMCACMCWNLVILSNLVTENRLQIKPNAGIED